MRGIDCGENLAMITVGARKGNEPIAIYWAEFILGSHLAASRGSPAWGSSLHNARVQTVLSRGFREACYQKIAHARKIDHIVHSTF